MISRPPSLSFALNLDISRSIHRRTSHDSRILVLFLAALPSPPNPGGARRNRLHASRRSASFEALEDRSLLSSVSFSTGQRDRQRERRHVQHPGHALGHRHSNRHHLRLRVQRSHRPGLRRAGNLYVANSAPPSAKHGERGDARGGGQHLRLRVQRLPSAWPSTRPATSTSPTSHQHGEQGDARGGRSPPSPPGSTVPSGLAFDAAGNLYVANDSNSTVSEVTPAGVVSTFASGFDDPDGLAFDSAGNLYVAN